MDTLYNENKFLIENRATYYAKKSPVDKEELISEGNLAFCNAAKEHKEERSKFSTHLWNAVSHSMLKKINREKKSNNRIRRKAELLLTSHQQNEFNAAEMFSKQAAKVVNLILEKELTHLSQVTKHLIDKGYQPPLIRCLYKEIRNDLYKDIRKKNQ